MLKRFVLMAFALAIGWYSYAQEAEKRLLIVYDSSNSMWGELADESRKYEAGRTALSALLSEDLSGHSIGLRPYGHRVADDCRDTELLVPFAEAQTARGAFAAAVSGIRPTGKTPITYSLRQGLGDLGERGGDILLISDGIETCDVDPCELMREWRDAEVNVRVHVVGVGLSDLERGAMQCIAETSGGQYFDADSRANFETALVDASTAIETPQSEPAVQSGQYALILEARNADGVSFLSQGTLASESGDTLTVTTNGRNVLPGAGLQRKSVSRLRRIDRAGW